MANDAGFPFTVVTHKADVFEQEKVVVNASPDVLWPHGKESWAWQRGRKFCPA